MDHETAVQLQAAERYVLDEFSPKERADFEEHFFGCPGCADEVRSATILAANTKVVLKEAVLDEENARKAAERAGRRNRLRLFWPLTASAALNFALLAAFGLARWHATDLPDSGIEPQFYRSFGVPAASRSAIASFSLSAGSRFFGARFDLMPGQHFDSFEYQILDSTGTPRSGRALPSPGGENSEMELAVPVASLEPGEYVLVLRGRQQGQSTEISRARFSIQR
ncbi:MAG: hypothetical protein DMG58_15905 [Acidobacteria bacterium]|nr:MAG: hypothetical protein DMG58_15905 [Acidobacteriota bacterium]